MIATPDPDPLLALAARVELADGPSRELDALVWCEIGIGSPWTPENCWLAATVRPPEQEIAGMALWDWLDRYPDDAGDLGKTYNVPAYTASLDAAMTLALPSWWLRLAGPLSPEAYGYSREEERIFRAGFGMIGAPYSVGASGTTLPLAIVAACLKGRAYRIVDLAK